MGQIIAGGEQFETHIEADYRGKILQRGPDSGEVDAFGRQRFSEPFTIFDSTLRYTKRTDQWYEATVGAGNTNYLVNESSIALTTTTASGDSVVRRSKRNMPYQPGKSLLVLQSFCGSVPTPGLIQEVGLFDNDNGVMLRASGLSFQFVIRSKTSGSVVENVVNQSSWNINTFPELIFSKAQIFVADLEWLGVGRVRCGFVVDGEIKYCHEFNHANSIDGVYMTTATLPVSYRLQNTTAIASSASLKQICCSVVSEGGYEPSGPIYTGGAGIGGTLSTTSETLFAAIRMASGRTDNIILPSQIDACTDGNALAQWRLYLNPTVSGVWNSAANGRGNVQVMTTGTFSGGTVLAAGLISGRNSVQFDPKSALALTLGKDNAGNSDVLALTIQCDTAMKATGLIGWRELY
jgi:hypothetical protein